MLFYILLACLDGDAREYLSNFYLEASSRPSLLLSKTPIHF